MFPNKRVLIDSSIWIDFFHDPKSESGAKLAYLLDKDLAFSTPLIKAEILSGARSEGEFNRLALDLNAVPQLAEPKNIWERLAYHRFRLLRAGHRASLADMHIALHAHEHGAYIFTRDKSFEKISKEVHLKFLK